MSAFPGVETTPLIDSLIESSSPVAIGVSGGKDSSVTAFETLAYLKMHEHQGPVILIHSDLGRVEHKDSMPSCQRLADRLRLPLVVVRREKGDMMDRWKQRWDDNLERYQNLECVKLILPWSTASMRFCTSEMKTAICCRDLVNRYPKQTIITVSGIRRQESPKREQAPVCSVQSKLGNKTLETQGYNWNPLLAWTLEEVLAYHQYHGFPLHEAYTKYGMSRVSCAYCILSSLHDLIASATNPENHEIYREMVDLEILSSFRFQSDRWLGDIAPHLLSSVQLVGLSDAKRRIKAREQVEKRIPSHLRFTRGWPTVMITRSEAILLSDVRRGVSDIMEISGMHYLDADAIFARYEELMAEKLRKGIVVKTAQILPVQQQLWSLEEVVEI